MITTYTISVFAGICRVLITNAYSPIASVLQNLEIQITNCLTNEQKQVHMKPFHTEVIFVYSDLMSSYARSLFTIQEINNVTK